MRHPSPTGSRMFQIIPAFAVPFAEVDLPDCEALNAELAALFLSREAEGCAQARRTRAENRHARHLWTF